ncbi:transposon-encoded TnpW family protein [Caproicibacter sp. BJN0012]|uniref:transposon-encoded TnpW family protein n=1 Tax=Caproicibacter sp. BJN0012 TaxID=3110227 RepID=UPI002E125987
MSEENEVNISAANSTPSIPEQEKECPTFLKKIGKTTYQVTIHFSTTNLETMSDKIKRMLRNEMQQL